MINLNENQVIATQHFTGPIMVLAGPGSGKTTVITYRVKNLVENYKINPNKILVISFTKASSVEMQNRFLSLCSANGISFSTFHAVFFKIIRAYYGYTTENILREEEKREIIKKIIAYKHIEVNDVEELVSNIILEFSIIASDLLDIEYYNPMNMAKDEFTEIFELYQKYKIKYNKIDFDDMLVKCFVLLKKNPEVLEYWQNRFSFILIDEFQDINKVQYENIKLLAEKHKNIFIVGDDDQSIYKFRGARPEFLISFPNDFPDLKKIILNVNYRSTEQIIKICNWLIIQNKYRYDKKIIGTDKIGKMPSILYSEDINSEALNIANKIFSIGTKISYNEMAVVYRNNIQGRSFIDVFLHLNIPFQIKDKAASIYEHWIFKDIAAYFRLAMDNSDTESLERIINKPSRYISKMIISAAKKNGGMLLDSLSKSKIAKVYQKNKIGELIFYLKAIKKRNPYDALKYIREAVNYDKYLVDYSDFRKMGSKGLFEIIEEIQESCKGFNDIEEYLENTARVLEETKNISFKDNPMGVTLSTMHSVKGLEYNTVFIASCVEDVIPYEKAKTESEIEEERRLFYVGLTRAKQDLYISVVNTRHEKKVKHSVFLDGLIQNRK